MTPQHESASRWLRTHTRDEHAAAEAGLDLCSIRAPADLGRFLRGWAGVWNEVLRAAREPGAAPLAGPELRSPAAESLGWLAADLAALEQWAGEPGTDPPVAPVPQVANEYTGVESLSAGLLADPAGVWGLAYVLRGSRLGGRVLAPALTAAVGLTGRGGTAFLTSEGADTGAEWAAFRRRLDGVALTADELAAAGAAARWTFGWVAAELSAGIAAASAGRPDLRLSA